MINAKEAREISTEAKLNALDGIEKTIKDVAGKGQNCIWLEYLDTCVIKELENLGYKVTYYSSYPDTSEYRISWEYEDTES